MVVHIIVIYTKIRHNLFLIFQYSTCPECMAMKSESDSDEYQDVQEKREKVRTPAFLSYLLALNRALGSIHQKETT